MPGGGTFKLFFANGKNISKRDRTMMIFRSGTVSSLSVGTGHMEINRGQTFLPLEKKAIPYFWQIRLPIQKLFLQ